MLNESEVAAIVTVYEEASSEDERNETVGELAREFGVTQMEIRQVLQGEKVYKEKEGRSEKQTYAYALWCITGIAEKEWMKLTAASQKKLMDVFRGGNS